VFAPFGTQHIFYKTRTSSTTRRSSMRSSRFSGTSYSR
jgi:hypothetical protein